MRHVIEYTDSKAMPTHFLHVASILYFHRCHWLIGLCPELEKNTSHHQNISENVRKILDTITTLVDSPHTNIAPSHSSTLSRPQNPALFQLYLSYAIRN